MEWRAFVDIMGLRIGPGDKQLSYLQLQELRPSRSSLPLRLEMLNPRLLLATSLGHDIKLFSLLFDRRLQAMSW